MELQVNQPHPYRIYIGEDLQLDVPSGPVALLFDQAVEGFAEELARRLAARWQLGIPGGEEAKSLASYARVLSWLASLGVPRDATLVVVGGGTLGDLGGFVAATYLRGIAYWNVPTTTLALVDASVGGKTGINLPEGKNLVGAFYAPQMVWGELRALSSLPLERFREGLVEAFKHGLLSGDEELLAVEQLSPSGPGLEAYLARAVQVKIQIVETDFWERSERQKLNLGHTLAHALESATQHRLSHGVAVAYGLLYAALLGRALGGEDLLPWIWRLLTWLKPPTLPPMSWAELRPFLLRDKKKRGEELRWVVPMDLGVLQVRSLPLGLLEEVYQEFQLLSAEVGSAEGLHP